MSLRPSFDNQRQAVIAALKAIGRPAGPKEVTAFVSANYGMTIADCGVVMADMEINGKSTVPANEKRLRRVRRGVYSL